MKILITGGAGFVGSHLALAFHKHHHNATVYVMDNLRRRGSETNLLLFKRSGINFVHGDIRNPEDFDCLDAVAFDVMIDCSADPSVHAGTKGSPSYVLGTNLVGTLNCLEFARKHCAGMIFLSTSRVYAIESLCQLPITEGTDRFKLTAQGQGFSSQGINETFPIDTARSFYGTSKLASELVIQEYAASYQLASIINRCSIIAGPGQFGKVDQGVVSHWLISHMLGRPLAYTGFGGTGKQVRDILHPDDLYRLIELQLFKLTQGKSPIYNVGGGLENSISLCELTQWCREITGHPVAVSGNATTASVDIPYYVTDHSRATETFSWAPRCSARATVEDAYRWLTDNQSRLDIVFSCFST